MFSAWDRKNGTERRSTKVLQQKKIENIKKELDLDRIILFDINTVTTYGTCENR